MKKKERCLLTALLVLVGAYSAVLTVLPDGVRGATLYVGGAGPGNYTAIQSAVNSATAGDTVFVYPGTYNENVNIYKTLTLMGEDRDTVIVRGAGTSPTFIITADLVTVSNFTLTKQLPLRSDMAILVDRADHCTIDNSTITESSMGIMVRYSDNALVYNNTVINNNYGIYFMYSNYSSFINNNVSNHVYDALKGDLSWHTRIIGNRLFFNEYKVIEGNWLNDTLIEGNIVSWNDEYGIIIYETVDSRVVNNTVSRSGTGIWSTFSERNWIDNNTIEHVTWTAISCSRTSNTTIFNNTMVDARDGIYLTSTEYITISNNSIAVTRRPITISGGVGQRIVGNVMTEGGIYGYDDLAFWGTAVIDSNTVNGKPLVFWRDVHGGTVPPGAGQIILAYCHDIVVENHDISNTSIGIHLIFDFGSRIANNRIQGSGTGIRVYESHNVTLDSNHASMNEEYGIVLHRSESGTVKDNIVWNNHMGMQIKIADHNRITGNLISQSDEYGIMLDDSRYNTLLGNVIEGNGIGMWVYRSNHNTIIENNITGNNPYGMLVNWSRDNDIYHNDFVINNESVSVDPYRGYPNDWDNGYPSGGNYWSDYWGDDNFSGWDQNQTGSDGIGDMPYVIWMSYDHDQYPLMYPYRPDLKLPPTTPLNVRCYPGLGQITIVWEAPAFDGHSNITSYRIFRGDSLSNMAFLVQVGNVLQYEDTDVTAGQVYYYSVAAVNSEGEGYRSIEVAVVPLTPPVEPGEPEMNWALIAVAIVADAAVIALIGYMIYRLAKHGSEEKEQSESPKEDQNQTTTEAGEPPATSHPSDPSDQNRTS